MTACGSDQRPGPFPISSRDRAQRTRKEYFFLKEKDTRRIINARNTSEEREAFTMTDEAKEARRAYKREWYRKNPEKVKAQQERFYAKKAAEAAAQRAELEAAPAE